MKKVCSKEECDMPSRARGLCANHYGEYKRTIGLCEVCSKEECSKPMHARGLCANHYGEYRYKIIVNKLNSKL